jgi:hypothetical protein
MYVFLGWFNVAGIVVMTAPFWLRILNKHIFKWRSPRYAALVKALRTLHKPLGIAIVCSAFIHGLLALGSLRLHTGTLLGALVVVTAGLGVCLYFLKKKGLLTWHRRMALLTFVLILVHLIFPSAVYRIFGA